MKRTLSLVLAFAMILTMFAGLTTQATSFKDVPANHWALANINYMTENGVLDGYGDGTFLPNKAVKKGEFIKMMNYTFGLTETKSISYTDVSASKWYYTDIAKAYANGYLTTDGYYVNPEAELTREEAAAMLARYLGLEASSTSYTYYRDASQISSEYYNYVLAVTEAGIFGGDNNNLFNPKKAIKRSEATAVLHRIVGTFANYGTSYISTEDAAITKPAVSLSNVTLSGDLLITEGAAGSAINLTNCIIYGDIIVKGSNITLNLSNTTANVVVTGKNVAVNATGTTVVSDTTLKAPATLTNNTTGTSSGFTVVNTALASGTATLKGKFATVNVTTSGTTVSVPKDSTVTKLNIQSKATNTKVTGTGVIEALDVAASGAVIETAPKKWTIASGKTAVIAGISRSGSGTAQSTEYPKFYVIDNTIEIKNMSASYSGTTYYMVVPYGATAPTAAQIKGGSYYNYSGSSSVYRGSFSHAAGAEESSFTSALTANTYYTVYYYTEYGYQYGYLYGTTVSATEVASETVYISASPVFYSQPQYGTLTSDGYGTYSRTITMSTNGANTAYIVAVPSGYGYAVPTASEVYDAANGVGTYKATGMVTKVASLSTYSSTITLTGLSYSTSYTYYVVLGNDNDTSVVLGGSASTATGSVIGTGFAVNPYAYNATGTVYMQVAATPGAGTVYFYPILKTATLPSSTVIKTYATYSHTVSSSATATSKTLPVTAGYDYACVLVGTNGVTYDPVRITMGTSSSTTAANVTYGSGVAYITLPVGTLLNGVAVSASTSASTLASALTIKANGTTIPSAYFSYSVIMSGSNAVICIDDSVYYPWSAGVTYSVGMTGFTNNSAIVYPSPAYFTTSGTSTAVAYVSYGNGVAYITLPAGTLLNGVAVSASTSASTLASALTVKANGTTIPSVYRNFSVIMSGTNPVICISGTAYSQWTAGVTYTVGMTGFTNNGAVVYPSPSYFTTTGTVVTPTGITVTVKDHYGAAAAASGSNYTVIPGAVTVELADSNGAALTYKVEKKASSGSTYTVVTDTTDYSAAINSITVADKEVYRVTVAYKSGSTTTKSFTITGAAPATTNTATVKVIDTRDGSTVAATSGVYLIERGVNYDLYIETAKSSKTLNITGAATATVTTSIYKTTVAIPTDSQNDTLTYTYKELVNTGVWSEAKDVKFGSTVPKVVLKDGSTTITPGAAYTTAKGVTYTIDTALPNDTYFKYVADVTTSGIDDSAVAISGTALTVTFPTGKNEITFDLYVAKQDGTKVENHQKATYTLKLFTGAFAAPTITQEEGKIVIESAAGSNIVYTVIANKGANVGGVVSPMSGTESSTKKEIPITDAMAGWQFTVTAQAIGDANNTSAQPSAQATKTIVITPKAPASASIASAATDGTWTGAKITVTAPSNGAVGGYWYSVGSSSVKTPVAGFDTPITIASGASSTTYSIGTYVEYNGVKTYSDPVTVSYVKPNAPAFTVTVNGSTVANGGTVNISAASYTLTAADVITITAQDGYHFAVYSANGGWDYPTTTLALSEVCGASVSADQTFTFKVLRENRTYSALQSATTTFSFTINVTEAVTP